MEGNVIHRYVAGVLGLMVLALFLLGWRKSSSIRTSPWLTTGLAGLILFQGHAGHVDSHYAT